MVQFHPVLELSPESKGVMVGGHGAGEQVQLRIAVAPAEVAQHLVVSAVLLDDVDDVADAAAHLGQGRVGGAVLGGGLEAVVDGDLAGQLAERRVAGDGQRQKARLLQLPDIAVGPPAR
jgi:hypothetical protein